MIARLVRLDGRPQVEFAPQGSPLGGFMAVSAKNLMAVRAAPLSEPGALAGGVTHGGDGIMLVVQVPQQRMLLLECSRAEAALLAAALVQGLTVGMPTDHPMQAAVTQATEVLPALARGTWAEEALQGDSVAQAAAEAALHRVDAEAQASGCEMDVVLRRFAGAQVEAAQQGIPLLGDPFGAFGRKGSSGAGEA